MTVVVPDASVILKWVLQRDDEPDTPRALAVLDAFVAGRLEIALPSLWRYEVANVLGIKQPLLAAEAMDTLLAYDFAEETLTREYCLEVLRLMREAPGLSFYDGAYHVLATRAKGVYLTADSAYVRRAGNRPRVAPLSDWTGPGRSTPKRPPRA
jgi:predicted nucleic acid-binding protein